MEDHPGARFIVETLVKEGFTAYYAGGWVRDFLLKCPSDDIDIATSAPPETIQALFPDHVPIGLSFGIILVLIDGRPYEVATFRQDVEHGDGRRPSKIAFSSAEEDAKRRDFTINGMFYNPLNGEILDFVGGKKDLEAKILRAIGDPEERMREDYLRMIRAVRLACRLHFTIEEATQKAIRAHAASLLPAVAIERILAEVEKARSFGSLFSFFCQLHSFGLLAPLFPELASIPPAVLESRLAPLKNYPVDYPLIGAFLPFFPDASEKALLSLCKRLKRTRQEEQFLSYFFRLKEAALQEEAKALERADWAHLYASPFCPAALQILESHLPEPAQASFCKRHSERMEALSFFIEKLRKKEAILPSKHLFAAGIAEGKAMGRLLKEAERTAINEDIRSPEKLLKKILPQH